MKRDKTLDEPMPSGRYPDDRENVPRDAVVSHQRAAHMRRQRIAELYRNEPQPKREPLG